VSPAEWLSLSAERDRYEARILAAERAAYDRGYEAGRKAGYEQAARDLERDWQAMARVASRNRPSFAELEIRRWGPGGRRASGHGGEAA
jgi:flagellar biosynthesis/type III secretory pathway protein FliH